MNRTDRELVGLVAPPHATVHACEPSIPTLTPNWLDAFGANSGTIGAVVPAGYGLFGPGAPAEAGQ